MKRLLPLLSSLIFALPAGAAETAEKGLAEIRELGSLNGQALACAQNEAVTRIKALMIDVAPKVRDFGAAFEEATNQAFLAQTKDQAGCQSGAILTLQAEATAQRLQATLPAQPQAVK